jgi:hypothetical protein
MCLSSTQGANQSTRIRSAGAREEVVGEADVVEAVDQQAKADAQFDESVLDVGPS